MDDERKILKSIINVSASYHPLGIFCNWLVICSLLAAISIAVFKRNVVGAAILVLMMLVVRSLIMWLLRMWLRKGVD